MDIKEEDKVYRHCIGPKDCSSPDCEYLVYNEHNTPCCGIDNVVGVKWFGCKPSRTKRLKSRRDKEMA